MINMPKFIIDEQTIKDIQLKDLNGRSVFDFFDETITEGAHYFLKEWFYDPIIDKQAIEERQIKIRRLEPLANEDFPFHRVILKDIEKFVKASHSGATASLSLLDFLGIQSPIYYYKKRNILETTEFLLQSNIFYKKINAVQHYDDVQVMIDKIQSYLSKVFKNGDYDVDKLKVNILNVETYERMIRYEFSNVIKEAIKFFYEIDALLSVAKVSRRNGFSYPVLHEKNSTGKIKMAGLYHIFHKKPVKNDVELSQDKRLWFLTGANMAGKSSIIKSISAAVYLTHIGFPVPADTLETDVIDGLFTSVNLQDNLELGYSHFYVEAIRLKEIMDQIEPSSNALVILDELFKGTNHSDASQAILEVMRYLDDIKGPFVIVSSHITELSEQLKNFPSIAFMKMKIDGDEEGLPVFTYKITSGIAEERLGMWLLKRSGVFESLNKLLPKN